MTSEQGDYVPAFAGGEPGRIIVCPICGSRLAVGESVWPLARLEHHSDGSHTGTVVLAPDGPFAEGVNPEEV